MNAEGQRDRKLVPLGFISGVHGVKGWVKIHSWTSPREAILDYLQALPAFSRRSPHWRNGLSPRAGLALLHCARAWAFLEGREMILPEDVQTVLPAVAAHRLQPTDDHGNTQACVDRVRELFASVALP